ncbi:MAG TPA: rod shape-determining protein MreD [Anaerolineales bacterium]|nr:rod shape-determining protein MreD [Anaerolineales bacterium]
MATLLALPILGLLLMLQTAVLSDFMLLHGTVDLILVAVSAWALQKRVDSAWQWGIIAGLLITIASGLPLGVALISYPLVVGIAMVLRQRVWQIPVLAMFVSTILSTIVIQLISLVALRLIGTPIPVIESLELITLPSILLNLLAAIPVFVILSDLAEWLYPEAIEV